MVTSSILKNQKGALMILISVMLLVLLTILSIAASRTAYTELKIAGNEYHYQRCFYNAEGAIMETVDLFSTTAIQKGGFPEWVVPDDKVVNDNTVFDFPQAGAQAGAQANGTTMKAAAVDPQSTGYMAVHNGVIAGSSLGMSKPSIHTFSIYGRCKNEGRVILKVGYKGVYK
jgi:hypothetical protein